MRNCLKHCRIVGGVDLAGSPRRPTGIAVVSNGKLVYADKVFLDNEILDLLLKYRVCLVAIDAPLSFSKSYRKVDLAMKRKGFKVLPPGWRGMRMLTNRAIRLKRALESVGVKVIETHPSSAIKSSGLHRVDDVIASLINVDDWSFINKGKDVVDAVISACVAWAYVECSSYSIEEVDGVIYLLPRLIK